MSLRPSLRAQNRLRAQRAAQEAALSLFEASGFDQVSVEQVAQAVGISARTLYRHFGTKEGLVLWDEFDQRAEQALQRQLGRSTPFADMRAALLETFRTTTPEQRDLMRRRAALVDTTPALLAALALDLEKTRKECVRAMLRLYPRPKDPAKMDMVVRIALAAMLSGMESWQGNRRASLIRSLEKAFDAAERALAD